MLKNSKQPPLARKADLNLAEVGILGEIRNKKVSEKSGFGDELGLGGSD